MNSNRAVKLLFAVLLILITSTAVATETTWRHPGFEVTQFDLNFTGFNASNIRWLTLIANGTPPVSLNNRSALFFDNVSGHTKYSENGSAYKEAFNNATEIDRGTIADARLNNTLVPTMSIAEINTILSKEGNFRFLGGVYNVTQTIQYTSNSTILCDSQSIFIAKPGLNSHMMQPSTISSSSAKMNVVISGCRFEGRRELQAGTQDGIYVQGTTTIVEKNTINGTRGEGISAHDLSVSIISQNNISYVVNSNSGIALSGNTTQNNIIYNTISYTGTGITLNGASVLGSNMNTISNNFISNTTYVGIQESNNPNRNIYTENQISYTGYSGMGLQGNDSLVSNNLIYKPQRAGISLYRTSNYTVSGNKILGVLGDGSQSNAFDIRNDGLSGGVKNSIFSNHVTNAGGLIYSLYTDATTGTNYISNNYFENPIQLNGNINQSLSQNVGLAGYNFGVKSAAPTPFGAGDTYFDTDVVYWCYYTGVAWKDMSTGLVTCT